MLDDIYTSIKKNLLPYGSLFFIVSINLLLLMFRKTQTSKDYSFFKFNFAMAYL